MGFNFLALAVTSVVQFLLGGIWYGPVFGSTFIKYHLKGNNTECTKYVFFLIILPSLNYSNLDMKHAHPATAMIISYVGGKRFKKIIFNVCTY